MRFLLVEKFFVINTPDTQPVTSICHIPTLQGVDKTCYPPGASALSERKPHETSKGGEAVCRAPCEDRLGTVAGAGRCLFSRLPQAPQLPREGLSALGLPAALIFFLAHIAAVVNVWRTRTLLPRCVGR